jgi:hypothetical protein
MTFLGGFRGTGVPFDLIKYITQMQTSTMPIAINGRPIIRFNGRETKEEKFKAESRKNAKKIKADTKLTKNINPTGVIKFLWNLLPVATSNRELIHFSLRDILYPH